MHNESLGAVSKMKRNENDEESRDNAPPRAFPVKKRLSDERRHKSDRLVRAKETKLLAETQQWVREGKREVSFRSFGRTDGRWCADIATAWMTLCEFFFHFPLGEQRSKHGCCCSLYSHLHLSRLSSVRPMHIPMNLGCLSFSPDLLALWILNSYAFLLDFNVLLIRDISVSDEYTILSLASLLSLYSFIFFENEGCFHRSIE